jgi:hypothetical protein
MIIVTGMPRSGTSLVMQTLHLIGYSVYGTKFPPELDPALNPNGFWECSDGMSDSIQNLNGDIAVKVLLRKLIERKVFGGADRIILCTRKFDTLAQKQVETGFGSSTKERCRAQIDNWYGRFMREQATGLGGKQILVVNHDAMLTNPTLWVGRIAEFAGRPNADVTAAIQNVGK